jgi:archaetidylinositol phosphate synthase
LVLENYRSVLDWWLEPIARSLRRVRPDTITWWALGFALLGAFAFWRSGPGDAGTLWLVLGWVCVGLNAILDLLDGKVAKMTGLASPRGDFLDHAVDRFSDALFLVGIGFSAWANPGIALVALAGTLLTSYMGTQAQAVGLKRNYGGLLGRADRMVLLLCAPPATIFLAAAGIHAIPVGPWTTTPLELVLVYFAVVGLATTVQRFATVLRSFGKDGQLR